MHWFSASAAIAAINAYMTYYFNYSVELAETLKSHDKEKQNKFYKSKYMRSVFECLEKFGFEIKGLADELENISEIEICYPQMPSVINVIKSFSMPRICRINFGFDYTKFNYRVFAHESTAKLPLQDLYTFQLLSDEHKDFLLRLDTSLAGTGVRRSERQHDGYSTYVYGTVKVRVTQNDKNELNPSVPLIVGKTPEQIHRKTKKIEEFIESLPDKYLSAVGKCRECGGEQAADCWRRFTINAKDKKYFICNNAWWGFPPEIDAIPYIIAACKI